MELLVGPISLFDIRFKPFLVTFLLLFGGSAWHELQSNQA
jgi:hypothetical protein